MGDLASVRGVLGGLVLFLSGCGDFTFFDLACPEGWDKEIYRTRVSCSQPPADLRDSAGVFVRRAILDVPRDAFLEADVAAVQEVRRLVELDSDLDSVGAVRKGALRGRPAITATAEVRSGGAAVHEDLVIVPFDVGSPATVAVVRVRAMDEESSLVVKDVVGSIEIRNSPIGPWRRSVGGIVAALGIAVFAWLQRRSRRRTDG